MESRKMLKYIKRFIQIPPHWVEIKRIGNSRFGKITMLVPFIGYMILFNEDMNKYLELSSKFVDGESAKDSNRLFYFYFGLSFIGMASIFFQLFCPRRIRLYRDALESAEYGMVLVSGRRILRVIQVINSNHKKMKEAKDWIPPQTEDFINRLIKSYKKENLADIDINGTSAEFQSKEKLDLKYEKQREFQKQAMHVSWALLDIVDRKKRLLILSLYGIGFLLLSIPTIDTFCRVSIAFWYRLFV